MAPWNGSSLEMTALELGRRALAVASRVPLSVLKHGRWTPAQADAVIAEIPQQKPFQGNDYFDQVGWGESVYAPVTTQLLRASSNTRPEDLAQMRRIASKLAEHGLYLNSHVEMSECSRGELNESMVTNQNPFVS